jgi:hypothetical protein
MNNETIDIKTYFLNYLSYLKQYKLKSDYKYTKNYYETIKKYIKKNQISIGGGVSEMTEKISKIKEVFEIYKNLNKEVPSLKNNMINLENQIDDISKKIENININDLNVSKINKSELEKVITSLEENTGKLNTEEFRSAINYYKIKPIDYGKFKSKNYVSMVINTIEKKIREIPSETGDNDERISKMETEIKNFDTEISTLTEKLKNEINKINDENAKFNDMTEYDYELRKKEIVKKTDFNGEFIRTIRNNFLNYTPEQDKLTLIKTISNTLSTSNLASGQQQGGAIQDNVLSVKAKVDQLYIIIKEYEDKVKILNENNKYITGHILYLTAIATGKLFDTGYWVFDYIGKNFINYYYQIVDDILKIYENTKERDEKGEDESMPNFNFTRDYITLLKLKNFLSSISHNTQKNETISINECLGETYNRLILLNYYKSILDEFKLKKLNKITMYARINDINKVISPTENDNFKDQKFFMSDNEKAINENSTESDPRTMIINTNACSILKNKKIDATDLKIKFTEVFDSTNYTNNNELTQYMGLNSLLSRKPENNTDKSGIILMTYGYSGTGKTYTLFGDDKHNGILQETLKMISKLKSVKFRLYEVYGYGLPYPHYWGENGQSRMDKISHKIFQYKLNDTPDSLCFTDIIHHSADGMAAFVKDYDTTDNKTYKQIPERNIANIFNDFSKFMETVEQFRKANPLPNRSCVLSSSVKLDENEKRRIRDTNNNIVSSRSILIYDFILEMDDERKVPFVIIDLPGREAIIQTYIEPYFGDNSKTIKELYALGKYNNVKYDVTNEIKELKMLFTLMALNPIGIALFNPSDIINFFNGNDFTSEERKFFFNTRLNITYDIDQTEKISNNELEQKYIFNNSKTKITGVKSVNGVNGVFGFTFLDEIINYRGGNLEIFFQISDTNKLNINNTGKTLFGYDSDLQKYGLVCIHLINRMLMLGKFNMLYKIYEHITKKFLNEHLIKGIKNLQDNEVINIFNNLQNDNFKRELISKLTPEEKKKEKLQKIVNNDYYLAPFEGIYINENIAGIIKYLSTNETLITDPDKRKKQLEILEKDMKQDVNLNFQNQQKLVRMWLLKDIERSLTRTANFFNMKDEIITKMKDQKYSDEDINKITNIMDKTDSYIKNTNTTNDTDVILNKLNIVPKPLFDNKLNFIHNNLDLEYDKLKDVYKSDKIFNFDKTLIQDIIQPYLGDIRDYKVLYLFGNYSDKENGQAREMKCEHQFNLLKNTRNFIKNIVEPNVL